MKKQFLSLLLLAALLCTLLPQITLSANAANYSGSCGAKLNWSLDTGTGALTITGSGEMSTAPWYDYRTSIKTISLPAGLTSISSYAFIECTGVKEITFPNTLTEIDIGAFYGCTGLTKLTLPAGITNIFADAFAGCTGLKEVSLPAQLTIIYDTLFSGCSSLTQVDFPSGLTEIRNRAFVNCTSLTKLTLPSKLTRIGMDTFKNCSKLTEVELPEGIQQIESGAFLGCTALESIVIPKSVTKIGNGAFGFHTQNSINHQFTIYGYADTVAQTYATKNGLAFVFMDDSLKFKALSLRLESDMTMTFSVLGSVLEAWSEPYVVFTKPIYNANGEVSAQLTRTVTEYDYNAEAQTYQFRFTGVTAAEMSSDVTATLYASRNGVCYRGATVSRSVQTYAMNQLGKTNDTKLKTLLVDMLNYGAAAQLYFNYNTSNLANASLTAEQQDHGTAGIPALESHTSVTSNNGATVTFKSGALSLREKVEMNITLNLVSYTGEVDALEARISYIDTNNAPRTRVIDGTDFVYSTSTGRYVLNFSQLNALQMRTVCTVEIFDKQSETRISDTLTYSIEFYACSKSQNSTADPLLAELVQSMMKYGDAARAFFGLNP